MNSYLYDQASTSFGSEYAHPELIAALPKYKVIRDVLENRVKEGREVYLPHPSEVQEEAKMRQQRYETYWARAQFLPVARRTQQGLVAQVFLRQPTVKPANIPPETLQRISIKGGSLQSLANYGLKEVVGMGRGAFVVGINDAGSPMVDFIETEHIITSYELPYGRMDDLGRNIKGCILRSFYEDMDSDGIKVKKVARLSQYMLADDGRAWVRFAEGNSVLSRATSWSMYQPVFFRGTHLKHVPVYPVGAEYNSFTITESPIAEICALNISHYINSADYEEHVKVVGQVTVVFSGLEDKWYKDHVKGQVAFGVRKPIPLNKDAKAELLQAQPNSTAKEAMDKKEKMMVAVGARLIEEKQVRKTATESGIEEQSYHSILGHIAYNVSQALTLVLQDITLLYGTRDETASVELNQDFGSATLDPEHRRLALEEWVKGVITLDEYRAILRGFSHHIKDVNTEDFITAMKKEFAFRRELVETSAAPTANQGNTNDPNKVSGSDNRT